MKIIAEVGSNWETLEDCRHSIRMAKNCGADAVKFQLYDTCALWGPALIRRIDPETGAEQGFFPKEYLATIPHYGTREDGTHGIIKFRGNLQLDWLPHLKQQADNAGIEFMCSAFSPDLIDAVDPYVAIHKVASAEMSHVRMLEKLKAIGKPVYLSTGGHNFSDVKAALQILGSTPVTLLHCVSAYPAQETNLGRIASLRDTFKLPVGYSDHSESIDDIPLTATKYCGAVVLEKHFKDKDYHSPDNGHSLNPEQFKKMVAYLKGERTDSYLGCENDMALKHNRRLIAIKDIKPGECFTEGKNFGIYRSTVDDTQGLHPFAADLIEGRVNKLKIPAGSSIPPMEFG